MVPGIRITSPAQGQFVVAGTFRSGVLLHTGDRSLRVGDRLYSAPLDALWRPSRP